MTIYTRKQNTGSSGRTVEKLKRLDTDTKLRHKLLSCCRLKYGQVWQDHIRGHRVAVLDAAKPSDINRIMQTEKAKLIINDPPYNIALENKSTITLPKNSLEKYMSFSRAWLENAISVMDENAHLYVWLGADYRDNFQPLPDFLIMMRDFAQLKPRNLITMRNQRGYGTQKNWMWLRQELLHYTKGNPPFNVTYTEIPKILKGYYKTVKGKTTENLQRSKSDCIRPGNVWVDIQQVFYRIQENIPGCYAQKPLKAIQRIMFSSSGENDLVADFFAHSGTTLIAGEIKNRKVYTFDIDPIFAEITIRRLEHYRKTGKTGFQFNSPFSEVE